MILPYAGCEGYVLIVLVLARNLVMNMNKNAPCFKCEIRVPGCHDVCIKYEAWRLTRNAVRAREKQDKEAWLVARKGQRRHRSGRM